MIIKFLTIIILACTLFFDGLAKEKKPDWVDYNKRKIKYPSQTYLTGFVSEDVSKGNKAESTTKLKDLVKANLLQSIKVDLKIESSLTLKNVTLGTEVRSSEDFLQNTYSTTQATIVGIQIETYYDSKKKINYAFAYASIKDIVNYYRKILSTNLQDIEPYFESYETAKVNNKIKALQDLDHIRENINKIKVAQSILIALKVDELALQKKETETYALKLNTELNQLLKDKFLSINEVCYFLAYGLYVQQPLNSQEIFIGKFTFSDTELPSPLSQRLELTLKGALLKFNYIIGEQASKVYKIKGRFESEDKALKISANLIDSKSGKIRASNYSYLNIKWLKDNNVEYIPKEIKKVNMLKNLSLKREIGKDVKSIGWSKSKNLSLVARANNEHISNLPILLSFENEESFDNTNTDQDGKAQFVITKKPDELSNQALVASIDIAKFLDISPSHPFIKKVKIPTYTFNLDFKTVKVYLETEEKNLGQPLNIPFLEPRIKQILTDKQYEFSKTSKDADLHIVIKANTRQGPSSFGISFSYIDATISIIDLASKNEIYKRKFSTIKGGGQNFELAGMKAYEMLSGKMKTEVLRQIE